MPGSAPAMVRRPTPPVLPDASDKPSGVAVATLRAFNPRRGGWGKTLLAIGIILANGALYFGIDEGVIPADGMLAVLAAQVFGFLTGPVIRHLGTRWKE